MENVRFVDEFFKTKPEDQSLSATGILPGLAGLPRPQTKPGRTGSFIPG